MCPLNTTNVGQQSVLGIGEGGRLKGDLENSTTTTPRAHSLSATLR